MMALYVGVKELRNNLRACLERVKAGEEIVVTERGKPVAHLSGSVVSDPLERLIAEGRAQRPKRPKRPFRLDELPRLRGEGSIVEFVTEQHGH
jgi:prevent-host-death family protein